ncbi:MAG TPA: PIN domain-containing protein [Gaiellaceae bacterium]|nr:PIN domain-containing protein [Gaiellaceae bacterium]
MIFVDTSFWVALRLRRDARHDDARALLDAHAGSPLVTSNHVRGETWTFLRARGGHRDGVAFLDAVERTPRLEVVLVGESLERESLAWLRRHDERPYSFVDATSFALMRSLGLREALAFDGDFAAAGFVELRPG